MKEQMQKIVIHSAGGYDRLKFESFPLPEPGENEVLVETSHIGVNYADVCIRRGVYESAKEYVGWPITPGFEFSGKVVRVGPGANADLEGQTVFGVNLFDGYSTHVRTSEHQVFRVPKSFGADEAAAFPSVFLTAYHALFQNVVIRPGSRILVHSAAGGVGTALLQLARIMNCEVVGVVGSSHKVETALHFGAAHVIDKSREALWEKARSLAPEGYDIILDANGPETLRQSYHHLKPTGKLLCYGFHSLLPKSGLRINLLKAIWGLIKLPRFSPIRMVNENKSLVCFNLSFLFQRRELINEAMDQLLAWIDAGKLQPPVVERFPFQEVARAHARLESGKSVGKLVLAVEDSPEPLNS